MTLLNRSKTMSINIEPVVKTLVVPLSQEEAFDLFTDEMSSWWPLDSHSVFQGDAERVSFPTETGQPITEFSSGGKSAIWGTLISRDRPSSIVFSWHPGRTADTAQTVEVSFTPEKDGTKVVLNHSGWDILGDKAAEARAGYDPGWDLVFVKCYGGKAGV